MEVIIKYFLVQIFFIPRRSETGRFFDDFVAGRLPLPEFITYGLFNIFFLFLIFSIIRALIKKKLEFFSFFNLYRNPHHALLLISILSIISIQIISTLLPTVEVYEIYKFLILLLMSVFLLCIGFFIWYFFRENSELFSKRIHHKIFFGIISLLLLLISILFSTSVFKFLWPSCSGWNFSCGLDIIIGKNILFILTLIFSFYSWTLFEKNKSLS